MPAGATGIQHSFPSSSSRDLGIYGIVATLAYRYLTVPGMCR